MNESDSINNVTIIDFTISILLLKNMFLMYMNMYSSSSD